MSTNYKEIKNGRGTTLMIDDEVFKNPPSAEHHVTYRLSVIKENEAP